MSELNTENRGTYKNDHYEETVERTLIWVVVLVIIALVATVVMGWNILRKAIVRPNPYDYIPDDFEDYYEDYFNDYFEDYANIFDGIEDIIENNDSWF